MTLDTALKRRGVSLDLRGELEQGYDDYVVPTARRQIVFILVTILLLSVAGLLADAHDNILSGTLHWKIACQVMIPAVALWMVHQRWLAPRYLWIAGAAPLTLDIACLTLLAILFPPQLSDRFVMSAGLAMIAANLVLPIRFCVAVPMTLLNIALYVGVPLALDGRSHVLSYWGFLLFASAAACLATAVAFHRERVQRKAFLLHLANERHTRELMTLVSELSQISYRDPLTGAGNRRSFDMRFSAMWRTAALRGEAIALIMIDVDHFKLFNDAVGHAAGDECLRAVAGAIAAGAGCPIEMVSRYGGEEFALIVPSTGGSTAESIRASVKALQLPHPGLPPGNVVTVSVGKAFTYPRRTASHQEALIRAADEALYTAKRLGRDRVAIEEHGLMTVA